MSSNPDSPNFKYKNYSLEKLQEWTHDAMNSGASPHEIYSTIRKVVQEEYNYHKEQSQRCFGLLELLSGGRPIKNENEEKWDEWEETYYPEEQQYTEEELNAMCDKAASDDEKQKCREYNLREAEYYDKRAKLDADYEKSKYYYDTDKNNQIISDQVKKAGGYDYTPLPETKKDKVKKWVLPVEEVKDEDTDENIYYVTFPDDLLEAAGLKEGDMIEWVDLGDGSYRFEKISKAIRMDEC